jgi:hypothetical protein
MVDAQINVFGPNAVKQSMLIFSRVFFKVCQLHIALYKWPQMVSSGNNGPVLNNCMLLVVAKLKLIHVCRYLLFESDFLHSNTYICMHSTSR